MGSPTAQDGVRAGGTAPGRVASPRLLRDPTTLESLASTLRGWTPSTASVAPSSARGLPPRTRSHDSTHGVDAQGMGADVGGGTGAPRAGDALEADGGDGRRVAWSAWGELESDDGDTDARRILLQAYEPSGLVIWDCSLLDSWYEILRLESLEASLRPDLASRLPTGLGRIVSAAVLPSPFSFISEDPWVESRPLIAIATHLGVSAQSQIVLYSLRSHQIVHISSTPLSGTPHRLESTARHVVLATSSPLALHILSSTTLEPMSFSPITDLAPGPFDGSPVWDLGKGGRALAYATTRQVQATSGAARFDPEPPRAGAGICSQRGMFGADTDDGEERERLAPGGDVRSAGQVGGEVARKVGEGMLKGARAIGDMGMNYWQSRNGQGMTMDRSDHSFSKSAPLPSAAPGWDRRGSLPALTLKSTLVRSTSSTSGTILVVDLIASSSSASNGQSRPRKPSRPISETLRTIAHFRPYSTPLALLALSPSSSSVLAASGQGQHFDLFELRPAARTGRQTSLSESNGKVWHRYRLTRGLTGARAMTATWTPDGRFVGVGTGKGTTHIFAIEPFGGRPELENHFAPQVTNATDLAPLSVTLSTIARIRPPAPREGASLPPTFLPPSVTFVSKAESQESSFRPPPTSRLTSPIVTPIRPGQPRTTAKVGLQKIASQDLLVYYPHSSIAVLERLSASPAPTSTVEAASRGDVGKMATTAVSGLSQLMRSKGASGRAADLVKIEWMVSSSAKAEWDLGLGELEGEIRESIEFGDFGRRAKATRRGHYSAQAEIETFSRSPRVLPRSLYLSPQFEFFGLPPSFNSSTSIASILPHLHQLVFRSSVQLRPGSASPTSLSPDALSPLPSEPHSYDQSIKSAMQTILDAELTGSPSSPAAFPNGVPGKSGAGRWRETLPIHAAQVNAGLAIGISTVRSGLGLVGRGAVHAAQAGAAAAAARRAGRGSGKVEDVGGSSVSFEDDAVFAEYREEGTDSTAATSERGSEECDEEGLAWGLDGLTEEADDEAGALADVEGVGLPFEDDFDDFILDRPAKVNPDLPNLLLAQPPIPIIDCDSSSASGGEDLTAPKKESHLNLPDDISSPLISAPSSYSSTGMLATSLSSSPASTTSTSAKKKSKLKKKGVS